MRLVLFAATLAMASPALADSQLVLDHRLPDADFYRAVSCGAAPWGLCEYRKVRWPAAVANNLKVKVAATQKRFARRHGRAGQNALAKAIAEINATDAGVHLGRVDAHEDAQIEVWFSDLAVGDPIVIPGAMIPHGDIMEGARVYVTWSDAREIDHAIIVVSASLAPDEIASVMLEELTQSLGFLTDLEGRAYAQTSIFSESSNAVTRLRGQDRMAIRRHYPPRN